MKAILSTTLFTLVCFGYSFAQMDAKVSTGVIAHDQGDYAQALKALDQALADISQLKEKNLPKAYYYRAKSRMGRMKQISQEIQGGGTPSIEDQTLVMNAVSLSWDDYKRALKYDDGKWEKQVMSEMNLLGPQALNSGLTFLNQSYTAGIGKADRAKLLEEASKYLRIAIESDPENYMGHDLLSQVQLGLGDSTSALQGFYKTTQLFEANKPKRPDQLIGYAYYRAALLERYKNNDIDKALEVVAKGKEMVDGEHERLKSSKDLYTDQQWAQLKQQHADAIKDLNAFELDLYIANPDKLDEALVTFEQAIKDEPNNYVIHVAFAQLLEQSNNFLTAIDIYEKAIAIDDQKFLALFNLGALYVNKGVAAYKKANEEDDYKRAETLQREGDAMFKKALPYLEKAHKIEPCDRECIKAILQICINLGSSDDEMMVKYKKYKAKKTECGF